MSSFQIWSENYGIVRICSLCSVQFIGGCTDQRRYLIDITGGYLPYPRAAARAKLFFYNQNLFALVKLFQIVWQQIEVQHTFIAGSLQEVPSKAFTSLFSFIANPPTPI